jgi:hypothetical protein
VWMWRRLRLRVRCVHPLALRTLRLRVPLLGLLGMSLLRLLGMPLLSLLEMSLLNLREIPVLLNASMVLMLMVSLLLAQRYACLSCARGRLQADTDALNEHARDGQIKTWHTACACGPAPVFGCG